jgi:hypothetical protein
MNASKRHEQGRPPFGLATDVFENAVERNATGNTIKDFALGSDTGP